MKAWVTNCLVILLLGAIIFGCVEPYAPPVIDEEVNFLVIDGFVNSSEGIATVRLTRGIPLSETINVPPEVNATVNLEDDKGSSVTLSNDGNGNYSKAGLSLSINNQYRLRIKTTGPSEYVSDFIKLTTTPPIDSVSWEPTQDGTRILVSTHDSNSQARYYQWTFEETWEYTSVYHSGYIYEEANGGTVLNRPRELEHSTCWRTTNSSQILNGSSERLTENRISNFPLTIIPRGSSKLFIRYSILVSQRSLTREAYDYWEKLKATTESLGGLFDPLPGKVVGNFNNVSNPDEAVLGYFAGGSVQQKRMFINRIELPKNLQYYLSEGLCKRDTVLIEDLPSISHVANELINILQMGPSPYGYTFSDKYCTDCRIQGGTVDRPFFW